MHLFDAEEATHAKESHSSANHNNSTYGADNNLFPETRQSSWRV